MRGGEGGEGGARLDAHSSALFSSLWSAVRGTTLPSSTSTAAESPTLAHVTLLVSRSTATTVHVHPEAAYSPCMACAYTYSVSIAVHTQ